MSHQPALTEARRHHDALGGWVAGMRPDAVPLGEVPELWDVVDGMERLVVAAKVLLARKVDESKVWEREGCRSAEEYMAQRSGTSVTMARAGLTTSKRLGELPTTEARLRSGGLSFAQAEAISSAARADGEAEEDLLAMAGRVSLTELRDQCGKVKAAADDKPDDTYARLRAKRRLKEHTDGEGAWCLSARGTPDAAGAFESTITPVIVELYRQMGGDGERLKRGQVAFDALLEICRRARCYANGIDITDDDDLYWDTWPEDPDDWPNNDATDGEPQNDGQDDDRPDDDGPDVGPAGDGPGDDGLGGGDPGNSGSGGVVRLRGTKRPKPEYFGALHVDLLALIKGHVDEGERCEIAGRGTIPASVARELLDQSTIKLVVTDRQEAALQVLSLGNGPDVAARIAPGAGLLLGRRRRPRRLTPTYLALIHLYQDQVETYLPRDLRELLRTKGQDVAALTLSARVPNAAQRFALGWTQPQCAVEGCCRMACQYDHREDYARTHHTRLDQLDRLCHFHHALKTRKGWALVEGTGKRPMVPPDDPRHPGNEIQRSSNAVPAGPPSQAA